MIIDLPRFIAAERPSWSELEGFLKRMEEEPDRNPTFDEAKRFHFLYQKAAADLARLATFSAEPRLREYLESLVARAYGEIHGGSQRGAKLRPWHWFTVTFPQVFRRRFAAFLMSLAITLVGVGFGVGAVALDDEAKNSIVPPQFSHLMGDPAKRVAEEESAKIDSLEGGHASFAGSLMVNNIRVSIMAMALGMTWGLGTGVVLFYNGVILGLVCLDYVRAGQSIFLMGWLLPHGVIEIPAILIAGQAGLVLGRALITRGDGASRAGRLRAASRDVATLIGGVALMLVWAGIIESFLSQHHQPVLPYSVKIAFGVAELCLLIWFLGRGARQDSARAEGSAK